MRDEFYADSRDVHKWTTLAAIARLHGVHAILQVALRTPDLGRGEGNHYADPKSASPVVREFFAEERKLFEARVATRGLLRVSELGNRLVPRVTIAVANNPFDDRLTYFNDLVRDLPSAPVICFLDPDSGISVADRPGPERVVPAEVKTVFDALPGRSVLAVFHYRPNAQPMADCARFVTSALKDTIDSSALGTVDLSCWSSVLIASVAKAA